MKFIIRTLPGVNPVKNNLIKKNFLKLPKIVGCDLDSIQYIFLIIISRGTQS